MTDRAYLIPDNYLPPGYKCIKIFVPDEQLYIEQFWAAYQHFTAWVAWEQDDLKRGRQVAFKWRVGWEMARELYDIWKGCPVDITNVRQNPANPCLLEYSTDNGAHWQTFADISKCDSGVSIGGGDGIRDIRIENNVIVGTDRCGDTFPLGPQSPPSVGGIVVPPYPEFPSNGQCLSATNAAEVLEDRLHAWANIRISVIGIVQYAIQIAQLLAAFLEAAIWSVGIWETYDEIVEWTEDNWNDVETFIIAPALIPILSKYYSPDGTMTASNHQLLVDELKTMYVGPPTTTTTDRAFFIVTFIVNKLGPVGMSRLANAAGITTADCDLAGWREVFDFSVSRQGWLSDDAAPYTPGIGWTTQENNLIPGATYVGTGTRRVIAPATITRFEAIISVTLGSTTGEDRTARLYFGDDQVDPSIEEIINPDGDFISIVWTGEELLVTQLEAILNVGIGPEGSHPGGSATINRIIVEGKGPNPFA